MMMLSTINDAFVCPSLLLNDKYGLFSSKGKQLLSCIYDDIFVISSNKALVLKQGKWFLFDSKTSKMTNTEFTGADKLGYMDRMSIPFPFFRDKKPYADTYFLLIRNGKYGVIDHQLNVLIPPTHDKEPIFYVDKHFTFGSIYSNEKTFLYTAMANECFNCKKFATIRHAEFH